MEKIIIYTMSTCGYCKLVKEELEKNNIEFETRLTSKWQKEWNKITSLTSMPNTPTIYYKNSYFVTSRDFNTPEHLVTVLRNFKKSEFNESRQILEKVKTLNFNISTAFMRLDRLLKQIETKINTDEHKSTN